MHPFRLLTPLVLTGFAAGAFALSTDREQPVRIDADRAHLDDRQRVAVYEGNVVLHRGSLRITGETVTMHFDEGYDLTTLVSEGSPADFRQQLDGGAVQRGQAKRIEYSGKSGAMVFLGDARVTQGRFEMEAHRIDYDSVNGNIKGVSTDGEPGTGRVTLTVQSADEDS